LFSEVIENRSHWRTCASIVACVKSLIFLTLLHAILRSKVIGLPRSTSFIERWAFNQFIVPFCTSWTQRLVTLPRLFDKVWSLSRTSTGVILLKIGLVYLTFNFTVFNSKIIFLPFLAYFFDWRTFHQVFIPQGLAITSRLFANPRLVIKNRIIGWAYATISLFNVWVIDLAFIYTTLSSKVVCLPKLAFLISSWTLE
jgi:hypothetical protein